VRIELLARELAIARAAGPLRVIVDGPDAAGKTMLAERLRARATPRIGRMSVSDGVDEWVRRWLPARTAVAS